MQNRKTIMKTTKFTCLGLAYFDGNRVRLARRAVSARTSIRRLLYYQAFSSGRNLSQADHDYLFTNQWQGQKLPARFGELIAGPIMSSNWCARRRTPRCLAIGALIGAPGPYTMLPHLARVKATVQMAQLRAMWDLQNGRQTDARDDLLAAYALARNGSRDNSLIAVLVQFAAEAIVYSTVAAEFRPVLTGNLEAVGGWIRCSPGSGARWPMPLPPRKHIASPIGWRPEFRNCARSIPATMPKCWTAFVSVFEDSGDGGTAGHQYLARGLLLPRAERAMDF